MSREIGHQDQVIEEKSRCVRMSGEHGEMLGVLQLNWGGRTKGGGKSGYVGLGGGVIC